MCVRAVVDGGSFNGGVWTTQIHVETKQDHVNIYPAQSVRKFTLCFLSVVFFLKLQHNAHSKQQPPMRTFIAGDTGIRKATSRGEYHHGHGVFIVEDEFVVVSGNDGCIIINSWLYCTCGNSDGACVTHRKGAKVAADSLACCGAWPNHR